MTKAEIRKKIQESNLSEDEKKQLSVELDKTPFPSQSFLTKIGGSKPTPASAPKKAEKKEEKKEPKPLSVGDNKKQPVADGK